MRAWLARRCSGRRARTEIVDDLARWLDNEIAAARRVPGARVRGRLRRHAGRGQGREPALHRRATRARQQEAASSGSEGGSTGSSGSPAGRSGSSTTRPAATGLKGVLDGGRALQLALYLLAAAKLLELDVAQRDGRRTSSRRAGVTFGSQHPRRQRPRRATRRPRRRARPDRGRDRRRRLPPRPGRTPVDSATSRTSATSAATGSPDAKPQMAGAARSPR